MPALTEGCAGGCLAAPAPKAIFIKLFCVDADVEQQVPTGSLRCSTPPFPFRSGTPPPCGT